MRKVDRSREPMPPALDPDGKGKPSEFDRALAHYASSGARKTPFSFTKYRDKSVHEALHRLFHGKCAYCEGDVASVGPIDIEHFRPKGAVAEERDHPGYWWLAAYWGNLFPSCIDCNRRREQTWSASGSSLAALAARVLGDGWNVPTSSGKGTSFPVATTHVVWKSPRSTKAPDCSTEGALLVNPCDDDPEQHIEFYVGDDPLVSLVLPKGGDPRGTRSIQTYGLNRLGLVQARTRLVRHLSVLTQLAIAVFALAGEVRAEKMDPKRRVRVVARLEAVGTALFDEMRALAAPEQPYSALVTTWLRQVRELAR